MACNPKSSRVLELFQLFKSGASINKQEFAEQYSINPRSVQRDIDTIRGFLANQSRNNGVLQSIEYNKFENAYKLVSRNVDYLTNGEMLAICKILLESRAFPKDKMNSLLTNMLSLCVLPADHEQIKDYIANELFNYANPAHPPVNTEYIWQIAEAIRSQHYIDISYSKLKKGETVNRKVMPVGILFSEFYFYLLGVLDAADVRKEFQNENDPFPTIYRIDRIQSLNVSEERFNVQYANRFKEGEYKNRNQFMFGGEIQKIRFKFFGPSIEAVLDKLPNAEVESRTDDSTLISVESFGTGILMWLLSQGSKVEILSPESLRQSWINEARTIISRSERGIEDIVSK